MTTAHFSDHEWDDIIVGAGSCGAVLASRLSEDSDRRVLLLEAGPDFPSEETLPAPLKDATAPLMSGYHWEFAANLRSSGLFADMLRSAGMFTATPADMLTAVKAVMASPQPIASTLQQYPYFLGKVVGGSSAVNGALALRGLAEDFDHWSALGNPEWSWLSVLPYFKKIETDRDFSGDLHGASGPLPISRPREQEWNRLQTAFHAACRLEGMDALADFNASSAGGVGPLPTNIANDTRISTALAYLAPARARPNLLIRAACTVHQLLFDGERAIGVELIENGMKKMVFGKRITLSAGAINTVPILLRSGIGDSRLCHSLGIVPRLDLPGVGENLVDHPAVILWMVPRPDVCKEREACHQVMARVASHAGPPNLNMFMLSNVDTASIPMLKELVRAPLASGISVVLSRPISKGRVFLNSAAPGSKPIIDLNFASASEDIEALMFGVRLAWKLARSSPLVQHIQSVFMWSDKLINNDRLLKSAITRFMGATWHAVGTARMGAASDPLAVVDQYCRVHRVENLRVVDASVMPTIPSAATNLTCIMLAERVADWMKQELG